MAKFLQRDQSQMYLLAPDLRDWLPEGDLTHFVHVLQVRDIRFDAIRGEGFYGFWWKGRLAARLEV